MDDLPRSVRLTPLDGRGRLQPKSFSGTRPPRPPLVADGIMHPLATTIIYGYGGIGKGWIAAYAFRALQEEGHNPVILDLEGVEWEWDERLTGMGVEVVDAYLAIPAPLTLAYAMEVADLAKEYEWTHGILDSASVAKGRTRDADSGGQDAAIALFQNIQKFGIPTLMLAHEAKKGDGPIGSVQYTAQARLVWHATAASNMSTELQMTKVNDRPLEGKPLTFTRVMLANGMTDVVRGSASAVPRKPSEVADDSMAGSILRIMRTVDRSMDRDQMQRALAEEGREVPIDKVGTMMRKLTMQGRLIRVDRGRYAFPIPQEPL